MANALTGKLKGGAEKQCALIAMELKKRGHHVVILDEDVPSLGPSVLHDGLLTIDRPWQSQHGIPGLRCLFYRIPSLVRKIRAYKPDVVYCRGTSMYGTVISLFSVFQLMKTKVVWGIAAKQDLDSRLTYTRLVNASWYKKLNSGIIFNLSAAIMLKTSTAVLCQTRQQMDIVKKRRPKKNNHIISNIYDQSTSNGDLLKGNPVCLWVGKLSGNKGERALLAIAKNNPDIPIRIVGHVTEAFQSTSVFEKLKLQKNLVFCGRLPYEQTLEEYKKAQVLIHTAPAEGFSNTFLEAWGNGCPVVSLNEDPNYLLSSHNLGYCSYGSLEDMTGFIRKLLKNQMLRHQIAKNACCYVHEEHSASRIGHLLEKALLNMVEN